MFIIPTLGSQLDSIADSWLSSFYSNKPSLRKIVREFINASEALDRGDTEARGERVAVASAWLLKLAPSERMREAILATGQVPERSANALIFASWRRVLGMAE